jgi:hypothetical protein
MIRQPIVDNQYYYEQREAFMAGINAERNAIKFKNNYGKVTVKNEHY